MSDTSNQKRQPKGIPVGGEFAANEHDEAVGSLAGALSYQGIAIDGNYEQSPLGLMEIPVIAEDEGLAMRPGEESWHEASAEELERYERYWLDVTDAEGDDMDESRPAFTIGFPSDEDTNAQVQWALENDATLTVDTDMGEIEMSGEDLRSEWENLAPGEGFDIVGAKRSDNRAEGNPYGASPQAIYVASEAGRLLRDSNEKRANELILALHGIPGGKDDHYAALSSFQPLDADRAERIEGLLDDHDITRADLEKSMLGEFGMMIPFDAPNGKKAYLQEHPNRILNRITDDYLEDIAAKASREK